MGRCSRILVLLVAATVSGCGNSSTRPRAPTWEDVLPNGSFERAGRPTLDGWRAVSAPLATFVHEAPAGGGDWCLKLSADWAPTSGVVYAKIPELRSGDVLRLAASVRAVNREGGGSIEIAVGKNSWQVRKVASSADTSWTTLSIVDTLALAETDSVWVRLSSFPTEISSREGLFDLVKLERLRP